MKHNHEHDDWDHAEEAVTNAFVKESVRRLLKSVTWMAIPLLALILEIGFGFAGLVTVPNVWLRIAGLGSVMAGVVNIVLHLSRSRDGKATVDLRSVRGERIFSLRRMYRLIFHLPLMILAGCVLAQLTSWDWGIALTVLLIAEWLFGLKLAHAANGEADRVQRFMKGGEKPTWEV